MGCLASKEEPLDFKADSATPVAPAAPAAPVTAANVEDVVPPCRVIEVLGGGNLKKTEPAAGAESAPTVIVIDPRCPANVGRAGFSCRSGILLHRFIIFLSSVATTWLVSEWGWAELCCLRCGRNVCLRQVGGMQVQTSCY